MFVFICLIILVVCIVFAVSLAKSETESKAINNKLIYENGMTISSKFETLQMDEVKKKFIVKGINYVFDFTDIIDYEYTETGGQVTKASTGNRMFNGTVATTQISAMDVIIRTRVNSYPALYIHFLNMPTKTDTAVYRLSKMVAEQLCAKLTQIIDSNNISQPIQAVNSTADEISKYKALLDSGAITQEEYDKKKADLLNL